MRVFRIALTAIHVSLILLFAGICLVETQSWLGLSGAFLFVTIAVTNVLISLVVWRRLRTTSVIRKAAALPAIGLSAAAVLSLVAALRHESGASFLFPIGGFCVAWVTYWLPRGLMDERLNTKGGSTLSDASSGP